MTSTVLQIEDSLFAEFGPVLAMVGITPTLSGNVRVSTPTLNRPIAMAVLVLGHPVANFSAVADADLTPVTPIQEARFHDEVTVRTLETILSRWDGFDQTAASSNNKQLAGLKKTIQDQLNAKRAEIKDRYEEGDEVVFGGFTRSFVRLGTRRSGRSLE